MSYFSHKWQCQNFTWRPPLVAFYRQNMKNHLWNWCKKVWTWGGYMNFTKKTWFFLKKLKKIEKNWKQMHQKRVAGCLWHDLNMPRICPEHGRTCSGHGRTHEDSYGFLKTQNWTKTNQDTDIFVLQIAEQMFQICSHFPTIAASKLSRCVPSTWQDSCGVIGVFEKSEFGTQMTEIQSYLHCKL